MFKVSSFCSAITFISKKLERLLYSFINNDELKDCGVWGERKNRWISQRE
jgi:hypothetical protein